MSKKITLIDGSGFIFRAYHALPPFTRSDGTPVGAVFGFCSMLLKFLGSSEYNTRIAVIFDSGRRTFRNDIYPEYKANRDETPEDLIPQFPLFREACEAFSLPAIEKEGFEADDIIAAYTKQAKERGYEVVIVSADKDLMQLIDDHVMMIDPLKNKLIKEAEVFEKFGVTPNLVIDAQSLIGDSSDNVPGVPSIGPKTAAELLQAFGSLDGIYANLDNIKQPKRREALANHKAQAYLSKELVTLSTNVPLPYTLDELTLHSLDEEKLKTFLRAQDFKTLAARFGQETPKQRTSYPPITDIDVLKEWLSGVKDILVIDTETTGLDVRDAELVGIALAKGKGKACYIPVSHQVLDRQLSLETVSNVLKPILDNPSILKVGHNLKYDLAILEKYDLSFNVYEDTLLMSYALDGSRHRHNLDALAQKYFNHTMISYKDVTGTGKKQKNFRDVPLQDAANYAGEDADYTFQLFQVLRPRLFKESLSNLYYTIEKPLIPIIQSMEATGISLDPSVLIENKKDFEARLSHLESEIFALAGHAFNIASPQQVSTVLFDEMGLPKPKKNKTGSYTTDSDALEDLAAQGIEIAEKLLLWRGLAKLISTYIDGLLDAIHPLTKRVHTSFHMAGTSTGRLSSSDPNLQNIPIKSEDGLKIRSAFVAVPGCKLVSFDYSQIELRLLAHMAHIPSLIESFKQGIDIHKKTASEMFHTPLSEVTDQQRRQAKAINFGIIYGISAYGLSEQLKIPKNEAQTYIETYLKRYPGIQAYMESAKAEARQHGFVKTLLGRHCYTPSILDKNFNLRQFAERQAINAPLQGSNADIIKKAMMKVVALLRREGYQSKLLLQIHDELIFEMPDGEIDILIPKIKALMENIVILDVPLIVDYGVGSNWAEI